MLLHSCILEEGQMLYLGINLSLDAYNLMFNESKIRNRVNATVYVRATYISLIIECR